MSPLCHSRHASQSPLMVTGEVPQLPTSHPLTRAAQAKSKGRYGKKGFLSTCPCLGKPFPDAPGSLSLKYYWPKWNHMPIPRPIVGKGEWDGQDQPSPIKSHPQNQAQNCHRIKVWIFLSQEGQNGIRPTLKF